MDDLYQATFEWPYSGSHSVIVTGSFDQWSSSVHLSKSDTGFKGVAKVPWNQKITYKFIVDGNWVVNDREPTETDPAGNVNNVYTTPEKPATPPPEASTDQANEAVPESTAGKHRTASISTLPQLVSDLATTITATDGTSSTLEYIASGVGAAIQSVVGIDPINVDKIPVKTPKDDIPTPVPDLPVDEPKASEPAAPETQVAPVVPVEIVPVNAPENVAVATEVSTTSVQSADSAPAAEPAIEPSTHTPATADASSSSPAAPSNDAPASETAAPQLDAVVPEVDAAKPEEPSVAAPASENAPAAAKEELAAPTTDTPASVSEPASTQQETTEPKTNGASKPEETPTTAPSTTEDKPVPAAAAAAEPPKTTPVPSAPSTPANKDSHSFPSDSPGSVDSSPSSSKYGTMSSTRSKRMSIFGRMRTVSIKGMFGKDKDKGKSDK